MPISLHDWISDSLIGVLVLALFLATPALSVPLALPYAFRWRAPAALYLLVPAALGFLGALGALVAHADAPYWYGIGYGYGTGYSVVDVARDQWVTIQREAGLGQYAAGIAAAGIALVAAASVAIGAGRDSQWTLAEAGLSSGVAWVFAVASLAYGVSGGGLVVLPGVLLFWGGLALGVASLRRADEGRDASRVAEGRLAVSALVLLSSVCVWAACRTSGAVEILDQIAKGSMAADPSVWWQLADVAAANPTWTGAIACVGALLAGAVPIATSSSALSDLRGALSGAVALVMVATSFAAWGMGAWSGHSLRTLSEGGLLVGVELGPLPAPVGLAGNVVSTSLPGGTCLVRPNVPPGETRSITQWETRSVYPELTAACGRDWTTLNGPVPYEEVIMLAVPASMAATAVAGWSWEPSGYERPLTLLVDRGASGASQAPGGVAFQWIGSSSYSYRDPTYLVEGPNGAVWAVHDTSRLAMEVRSPSDLAWAVGGTSGAGVALVPGATWTAADLVRWCVSAQDALKTQYAPVPEPCLLAADPPNQLAARLGRTWPWQGGYLSPNVTLGTVVADFDVPPDFEKVLYQTQRVALQDCFQSALYSEPSLSGSGTLAVTIRADGGVDKVELLNPTWIEPWPSLGPCIVSNYQYQWFPERTGGRTVTLKMPLTFAPATYVTP